MLRRECNHDIKFSGDEDDVTQYRYENHESSRASRKDTILRHRLESQEHRIDAETKIDRSESTV